ncbi:hypothetical protein [Bradyrhizobium stylosanthis]|uniref:Uncharacterized protein n=1 Tax=Bradyrhizobium stylosanthis TaxID=1803665 RepID=A0A560CZP8_9BRAD|nr:hypothetical protein [Bradyrhizobium stylosanthis]TWA90340.1 hypothetical protein FBZ96_1158 [Bradyrhizobium stylosanthis]
MKRLLIFGLLGPALTYLSMDLATRTAARWWWPQPAIYLVVLVPLLLTGFADRSLRNARLWERLVSAGFVGFVTSGLACALAYRDLGALMFGFRAAIPAIACSLVAAATDAPESTSIE